MDQGAEEVLIRHEPDGNRATVRNALARKATGRWLCFLDGDDELAPGYIDAMAKAETENALLTPRVSYVVKGRARPPKFWPEVPMWSGNWMVLGTLVERDLFHKVGGWREFNMSDWNEWDDWDLWIRCQKAGAQPIKVKNAIYIAHQEKTSRHRSLPHEQRIQWTYEIGHMHFPERYPVGWNG